MLGFNLFVIGRQTHLDMYHILNYICIDQTMSGVGSG